MDLHGGEDEDEDEDEDDIEYKSKDDSGDEAAATATAAADQGLRVTGWFTGNDTARTQNTLLQKQLQRYEENFNKQNQELQQQKQLANITLAQDAAIKVAKAKISTIFMNSTNKLFANIVPQLWRQVLRVHGRDGTLQKFSTEHGIVPLLQYYFKQQSSVYEPFVASMRQFTNEGGGGAKVTLNYVETYVHNLIGGILQDIGFLAIDTVFHYSLTKALTPFVLHMFVAGQHIPNICVAFILDMCIAVPALTRGAIQNPIGPGSWTHGKAKELARACLTHEYAAHVTRKEFEDLVTNYVAMYETFATAYNSNIKDSGSFYGIEKEPWPMNPDILEMQALLFDVNLEVTAMELFRTLQRPQLRF